MKRKITFLLSAIMLLMVILPEKALAQQTVTWTRVTDVQQLTSGGTFIIGYEPSTTGTIVPMRNAGTASTSSTGYLYSGNATGTTSNNSTITMSTVTSTSSFEVNIVASTIVNNAICIKIGNNFIGNQNSRNCVKLYANEANYTAYSPSIDNSGYVTLCIDANTGNATNYKNLKFNNNSGSYRFAVYSTAPDKIVIYKKTCSVSYNANGGSGTMTDSNSPYPYNTSVTTKTNTFTAPSGKVFNHWNTASDDSGSSYAAGASFPITANTTLYAIWSNAGNYINVDPTTKNVTCAAQNAEFTISTDQTLSANPVVFYTTSTGDVTTTKPSWIEDLTSAYSSSTLTIPVTANTGAARTAYFRVEKGSVQSDVITINQAVYAPSAPTLPAAGNFDYTKEITITVPSGTTVYYTLDGTDPTSSSTQYNGAFTINATTTVKAVAYDNGYPSSVVSATYTRVYETMSDITSTSGTHKVKGTVVAKNNKGFIVADHTGYMYYYQNSAPSQNINAVVEVSGSLTSYGHVIEFNSYSTVSGASSPTYTSGIPTVIDGDYMYDVLNAGTTKYRTDYQEFVGDLVKDGSNYNITVKGASNNVTARASYATDAQNSVLENLKGKTVKVRGYYAGDASSIYYVMLGSVEAVPVLTTSVTSISNFTYNVGGGPDAKSFTVAGANLTDDITVSTNSENFEISSDNSSWQTSNITISKESGTVAATTIYVRLKSNLSSNTYNGKITVSSDGADDKEIALTGTVKHTIAISGSINNGSVESDPSDAAVAGATVTLTANPAENYKLGSFTVTKAGSGTVEVTSTGANTGTFEMPADNVTVSATFTQAYTVTYVANGGSGTMTDTNSPYIEGAQVTLLSNTFTYAGHTWSSWSVKDASQNDVEVSEGKFTMPASAVTVTAQWNVSQYTVALSEIGNVTLLASYGSGNTITEGNDADIDYGTEITLSATDLAEGKVFVWNVVDLLDNDVTEDVLNGDVLTVPDYDIIIGGQVAELFFKYSGDLTEGDYIIANGNSTYAMLNTINNDIRFYRQTISPSNNQIIVANASTYLWHIASSGDYWTIYNAAEEKYVVSTGTSSQAILGGNSDDKCLFSVSGTTTYTFVSKYNSELSTPANAQLCDGGTYWACYKSGSNTLYKKAVGSKHSVVCATGLSNGSISASPSSAYEGQPVALTAEPSSGYMLDSWDVYKTDDASTKVTVKGNSFTMPGYDVTVSATFRVQHTYTLVDGSSVKLEAGKHYIIANGGSGTVKVMGAHSTDPTKNGYRTYIDDVTVTSSQITEANGMYEVVFSGDDTNYWTMYDEIYGLFICSTNSSGSITHSSSISNNTKWTVSITTGEATITARGGSAPSFRYNSSYPRFTGYTSGQQAVYLYKRDGDTELEIYSNTSLADPTLSASNKMTVESGATLTFTGNPSCTNASWLVVENGGELILSNSNTDVEATVKKTVAASTAATPTIPAENYWYAISSPTHDDGQYYESFSNVSNLTPEEPDLYNVYRYDEKTVVWQEHRDENNEFNTMKKGRGYLFRSTKGGDLEYSGVVNTDIVQYNLSWSCPTTKFKGFNLIGNPYTHTIYKGAEGSAIPNGSILEDKYYTIGTNGRLTLTADGTAIAPGQAIFVQAKSASTLTMNNSTSGKVRDKYANDNIWFMVKNAESSDLACVEFRKGHGLNKVEHRNDITPMLYIMHNGENFASADMSDNTSVINLGFEAKTTGEYTFSLKARGTYSYMHLIDKITGADVDMLIEDSYSFVGSPRDRKDRFELRLNYNAANIDGESDIFAYQNGTDIIVRGEGELQVFDVTGRMAMRHQINGVQTVNGLNNGVYIFRLVGNEVKTQKIVVR